MDRQQSSRSEEEFRALEEKVRTLSARLENCQKAHARLLEKSGADARDLAQMRDSLSWRITKPLRSLKKIPWLKKLWHGIRFLLHNGLPAAVRRKRGGKAQKDPFTEDILSRQRAHTFEREILFSVVVPLYNTPEKFLREMIESVESQTYPRWELCMADGSDENHGYVERICRQYAENDPRIRYRKLPENMGISGNTNACLEMANGEYIGLFDHDDLLHPAALFEVMTAICQQNADFIYTDENTFRNTPADAFNPHYKPDFAPDTLRANNYICHFTVFSRALFRQVGGFRPECDGSQDYDMVLRLTEKAEKIVHIPEILYYWRAHSGSVADSVGAKPYVIAAAHRALSEHLQRVGLSGQVLDTRVPSLYRIRYDIEGTPLVSVLIPNCDHISELKVCLESLYALTSYENFEVLILENNSKAPETFAYYEEAKKRYSNLKVLTWNGYFNYSAINNFGAADARGDYLLLLNNDTEILTPDWIREMLMFAQRPDVGAVGAKLYYPDGTIQHAGVGIGLMSLAAHLHRGFAHDDPGYMGRLVYAQDVSAVTAACMLIPRRVWDEVGGLDESFEVAFNDVDLCMRIRKAGHLIVWTPFAELCHYESKSRGADIAEAKRARFEDEVTRFQAQWREELSAGDPYYNPNFSRDTADFRISDTPYRR